MLSLLWYQAVSGGRSVTNTWLDNGVKGKSLVSLVTAFELDDGDKIT
jgi:hypothetical protein